MYTPKERVELLISMLGEQLNEHGYFFKISKTRLSWKNKEVSVVITPRGSHYSDANVTTRWIRIRVESYAMRKLAKAGAPLLGPGMFTPKEILADRDLCEPGAGRSIEVSLTDWWSIEDAAKHLASSFDAFWREDFSDWLSLETAITHLSTNPSQGVLKTLMLGANKPVPGLTVLYAPDAPPPGSQALHDLIREHKLDQQDWQLQHIAELLLASGRDEDFWRIIDVSTLAETHDVYTPTQHGMLNALAEWKRAN